MESQNLQTIHIENFLVGLAKGLPDPIFQGLSKEVLSRKTPDLRGKF